MRVSNTYNLPPLISQAHLLCRVVSLYRDSGCKCALGLDYGTVEEDMEEHHH